MPKIHSCKAFHGFENVRFLAWFLLGHVFPLPVSAQTLSPGNRGKPPETGGYHRKRSTGPGRSVDVPCFWTFGRAFGRATSPLDAGPQHEDRKFRVCRNSAPLKTVRLTEN